MLERSRMIVLLALVALAGMATIASADAGQRKAAGKAQAAERLFTLQPRQTHAAQPSTTLRKGSDPFTKVLPAVGVSVTGLWR